MRYAKLINSYPQYAPNPIIVDGRVLGNPTDEMLADAGYLPVIETEPPEVDELHYAEPRYVERDGQIVQEWDVVELPEPEATPEDYEAALAELGVVINGNEI